MLLPISSFNWSSDSIMALLIFGLPVVTIISGVWWKISKHQADTELKRSMIERGMSADEIEKVLAAGRGKDHED